MTWSRSPSGTWFVFTDAHAGAAGYCSRNVNEPGWYAVCGPQMRLRNKTLKEAKAWVTKQLSKKLRPTHPTRGAGK